MKVIILGGGITGLSAAWFLHKNHPEVQITLIEKTDRLGGWIQTSRDGGFLFEKGPRTFLLGKSPRLLELIRELKLDIITAKPQARYLWHQGKLRNVSALLPKFIPYFIREMWIPRSSAFDESIYDFAARRFSPQIAELFFDPMTLGIYGGDMRTLSLRSCFPMLYKWEQTHGSIVRGFLASPKSPKGLFTLPQGMDTLIDALQKQLPIEIVFNCPVETVRENEVVAGGKIWRADQILSALPSPLPARSLWVVHLAYEGDVLPKKGFGYLIPTKEKESVLGVIFDSSIFPQQNRSGETRLTAMVRAEETKPLEAALEAVGRHLCVKDKPIYTAAFFAKDAIPQWSAASAQSRGISVESAVERGCELAGFVTKGLMSGEGCFSPSAS